MKCGEKSKSTENGELGHRSKVATAKRNPNARSAATKVICVYTYDYEDTEDVKRVRGKLRELGFVEDGLGVRLFPCLRTGGTKSTPSLLQEWEKGCTSLLGM